MQQFKNHSALARRFAVQNVPQKKSELLCRPPKNESAIMIGSDERDQ